LSALSSFIQETAKLRFRLFDRRAACMKKSSTTAPRRGRGRPVRPELDALQKEFAVSRRRAAQLLKDGKDLGALGKARLEKLMLESERLRHLVRVAELEAEQAEGRLLSTDDALMLYGRPLQAGRALMDTMPRELAPRLTGQPQKTIENTLRDWIARLVDVMRVSLDPQNP
jgi:hypothetical protein